MLIDWTSVATISTRQEIETFPTVNLVSFSDGSLGNGSGIPYLYLTPLDFTSQDITVCINKFNIENIFIKEYIGIILFVI